MDTHWQVTVCRLQNHTVTTLLRQVQQLHTIVLFKMTPQVMPDTSTLLLPAPEISH